MMSSVKYFFGFGAIANRTQRLSKIVSTANALAIGIS